MSLSLRINIHNITEEGNTILHKACIPETLDIYTIRMLYRDYKASFMSLLYMFNNNLETPFLIACKYGNYNIVREIIISCRELALDNRIIKTSFINDVDIHGMSPALYCYKNNNWTILRRMIRCCDVDLTTVAFDGFHIPEVDITRFNSAEFLNMQNSYTVVNKSQIQTVPKFFMNEYTDLLLENKKECKICENQLQKDKIVILKCFHHICSECEARISLCPFCREKK